MSLIFSEQPYSGTSPRPRPEVYVDGPSGLVILATPWGDRSVARKVIDRMTDYLVIARKDREATSPFQRLSCLSAQANNLRIAALLANESLYRVENKEEYRAGVELFAGILEDDEFSWLQAGSPHILLGRKHQSLSPLGSQLDLAADLSEDGKLLPPLPAQLLGIDSSINLNIGSFRARPGDRVVLLSHSRPPESIYSVKGEDASVEKVGRALAVANPDYGFWLGVLEVSGNFESGYESSPEQETA